MICDACSQDKPLDDFPRLKQFQRVPDVGPEGRRPTCKTCIKKQEQQAYYQANKAKVRAQVDQWRKDNPEARKKSARDYARKQRWAVLGITQQQYDDLIEECGDACNGCRRPFSPEVPACVDHCHDSGAIRGLLCHGCNLSLGYAKDDPARLDALAAYLRRHEP